MPDEPALPLSRRRHAPKGPVKVTTDPLSAGHPMPRQQCTAFSKQKQQRCARNAIPGGTVCYWHGGNAPQVKEAARQRYEALEHPAVARIGKLIDQEDFPTVAYAASKDVLDRLWGKAAETVNVTTKVIEDLPDDELVTHLRTLMAQIE